MKKRCEWADPKNSLYVKYHDEEWGTPVHDDKKLFEFLILEGAQAGLSWSTILKKRENYRKAYDTWNVNKIAKYGENKIQELLNNEGIVRNKLKVRASIKNAQIFKEIQKEYGSFDAYIWNYVNNTPIKNTFKQMNELPATTPLSDTISKDLKKRGMSFVGSTIIYAFMQAIGMVNDHEVRCFRYSQIS